MRLISGNGGGGPKPSAFGDSIGVRLNPQIAISGVYGLRSNTQTFIATGGSAGTSGSEIILQTGTSVGGYAVVWSRRPLVYQPGAGAECRITGRFTSPVALSLQAVGMFSSINGMFFGYNGTSFGVMHRYGGGIEIRELTITAASGSSATATVTLNGVAYTAAVTNTTAEQNAHQIADGLLAGAAGLLWEIQAVGATVVFQFKGAGAKSGAYSLSVNTGTLAGNIVQDIAGATPTETWTAQADWNVSVAAWLDTTKGNIFKLEYAFLGYGPLKFSAFNPASRDFELVHVVDWTNANTQTNFNNPSMRPGWVAASLGSTTNLTVVGGSAMGAIQGESVRPRPFGHSASQAAVTTEAPVMTIQVRREFNNRALNGVARMTSLSLATDGTKGAIFRVYVNASLTGPTQWEYDDKNESIMLVDSTSTGVSGGDVLGQYVVGPSGSATIGVSDIDLELIPGDTLTITAERVSGAAADMAASATWGEYI